MVAKEKLYIFVSWGKRWPTYSHKYKLVRR